MICVDSNIFIYSVQENKEKLRQWISKRKLACSIISMIEVLGYQEITPLEIELTNQYFDLCKVIKMNHFIVQKAISLRQQKSMSLGDAIIAATAIQENIPLLTANTKDFQHIRELELLPMNNL